MVNIRYKYLDKKKALSIIEASEKEMNFTFSLQINEDSGSTIIRNIYEDFRMLGEALLIYQGLESEDHIETIKELLKIKIETERPLALVDNLRRIRNNINYRAYRPKLEEIEDALSLANSCFSPLAKAIKQKIENKK